jgi:hypothetical protein
LLVARQIALDLVWACSRIKVVNIDREFMLVIDTISPLCLEMVSSRIFYIAARNEMSLGIKLKR